MLNRVTIPFLSIYPREMKYIHTRICNMNESVHSGTVHKIKKNEKNPKVHQLMDKCGTSMQ